MYAAYRQRRRVSFLILILSALLADRRMGITSVDLDQAVRPDDGRSAAQVFKNIQVLKDMSASQLALTMDFMAASLGVSCSFCHTSAMESDEKSTKSTTRKMIEMTRDINKQWFSGFGVVNCNTCHRGHTEPVSIPEIDLIPRTEVGAAGEPAALPSADTVLSRFEDAAGGIDAIRKITTCVLTGSQTSYEPGQSPQSAAIEVYQKAPDRFLYLAHLPGGNMRVGFDGKTGWIGRSNDTQRADGVELAQARRDWDLLQYLNLRQTFSGFRVLARDKLGDRSALVAGAVGRDGSRLKLYFDESTGRLLRFAGQTKTPYGMLPDVTDLEDYRKVGGVAFPFRIKRSRPPSTVVQEFKDVRINVPIDDSLLAPPQR